MDNPIFKILFNRNEKRMQNPLFGDENEMQNPFSSDETGMQNPVFRENIMPNLMNGVMMSFFFTL